MGARASPRSTTCSTTATSCGREWWTSPGGSIPSPGGAGTRRRRVLCQLGGGGRAPCLRRAGIEESMCLRGAQAGRLSTPSERRTAPLMGSSGPPMNSRTLAEVGVELRRRCRALRAAQALAPQRPPFCRGLWRPPGQLRHHRPHGSRSRHRPLRAAPRRGHAGSWAELAGHAEVDGVCGRRPAPVRQPHAGPHLRTGVADRSTTAHSGCLGAVAARRRRLCRPAGSPSSWRADHGDRQRRGPRHTPALPGGPAGGPACRDTTARGSDLRRFCGIALAGRTDDAFVTEVAWALEDLTRQGRARLAAPW